MHIKNKHEAKTYVGQICNVFSADLHIQALHVYDNT